MILYWKLAAISLFSIFVHVNHIIIFLLSLQRFILLFFPSSESYVRLFEKRTSAVIFALYFILSLLNLSFLVWTMSSAGKDFLKVKVYVVKYFLTVNNSSNYCFRSISFLWIAYCSHQLLYTFQLYWASESIHNYLRPFRISPKNIFCIRHFFWQCLKQ